MIFKRLLNIKLKGFLHFKLIFLILLLLNTFKILIKNNNNVLLNA